MSTWRGTHNEQTLIQRFFNIVGLIGNLLMEVNHGVF